MANGNQGIGSFLPFPTFGGEKSGGITPVQLSPMRPNFPTPRAINRRTPEPEFKEKIGGLAPLALQGIGQLFGGDDTPRTPEQYAMDELGLTEQQLKDEDLTKLQRAQLEAYSVYGEAAPKDDFGWDEIANIAAASMMGRGADDYATTYLALKKAAKAKEATKEISRADFIKSRTDATPLLKNFVNTDDAKMGINTVYPGYYDADDPRKIMIHTPDGFKVAGSEWAIAPSIGEGTKTAAEVYSNPNYTDLTKSNGELQVKEIALANTINLGTDTVDILQQGIDNPGMASGTIVATTANFLNDVGANYRQVSAAFKDANKVNFIDETVGTKAQALRNALDSGSFNPDTGDWDGDVNQLDAALAAFEKDTGFNLMDKIGKVAYNNVALKANFLQLAYMAAATSGQTGRTLSDKDLAFFLQIVGFGASQDPTTQKDNLLRFMHSSIRNFDSEVQLTLRKDQMSRYKMDAPEFQAIVQTYYNWGDSPLAYSKYEYIPFLKRNRGIGNIDRFQTLKGKFFEVPDSSSVNDPTVPINTAPIIKDRIKSIEDLY
jgi:hypothetical protein